MHDISRTSQDQKRLKFLERQFYVSKLAAANPKYLEFPNYYMKQI